ncbi:very short patch repair endonuclease [Georgfuchsia toluolica]|uniref:very short patch repair endonuclease n=1 Tax=Georgfuchsia toluolica TaxID=424218 RepID=UPI001FE26E5D|nr:very short patch repair endonuclease [Georgfuchsia toluolica]
MADKISRERRSANMRSICSKNTTLEMVVRRLVHGMGYRYRLHRADLPGKPDIVFVSRHKVIFVHGCFWHQHRNCKIGHLPKSNLGYWVPKLNANRKRDAVNKRALRRLGWEYLVVWECEIFNKGKLVDRLKGFLK